MKQIYLLRHAKSSWADGQLSDHDRPLNKRGLRDAPRMGLVLSRRLAPIEFAVSSAARAQHTFDGLVSAWPGLGEQHRHTDAALYTFDVDDLLAWVSAQSEPCERIALIGHNPALTDLVNVLVGDDTLENLPTAGWVELSVPIAHWRDVHDVAGRAVLDFSLFPRELSNLDGEAV